MNESVVEGGEDASNTEDELALSDLGAERDGVLGGWSLDFLGGLVDTSLVQSLASYGAHRRDRLRTTSNFRARNPAFLVVPARRKRDERPEVDFRRRLGIDSGVPLRLVVA